jgi:thioredoxin-like negative regulator of GroEL
MGVLMRPVLVAAVVVCGMGLTGSASVQTLRWHSTLEEASAAARRANQPMFLDFWAEWCPACKVMDADVYPDAGVVEASEPFASVRIDFDKNPRLARKYNVKSMPSLVVTDSYGVELFRYSGMIGAAALSDVLRALPHDVTEFNRLTRLLDRNGHNVPALSEMGERLRAAGLPLTSNDYYRRALERREVRADSSARETILSAMALNYLDLNEGRLAAETFDKCLKEFPKSQRIADWTMNLSRAQTLALRQDQARKYLGEALRRFPIAD